MKKHFENAEIELIHFAVTDVISTSTGNNGGQDQGGSGNGYDGL